MNKDQAQQFEHVVVKLHIFFRRWLCLNKQSIQLKSSFKVVSKKYCRLTAWIDQYQKYLFFIFPFIMKRLQLALSSPPQACTCNFRHYYNPIAQPRQFCFLIKTRFNFFWLLRNLQQHFAKWYIVPHLLQRSFATLHLAICLGVNFWPFIRNRVFRYWK